MRGARMAAGVAAVGLALAGCGGDSGSTIAVAAGKGGGADLFEAMAEAQADAGSYRFELSMEAEGQQISGEGAASVSEEFADADMEMTMEVPVDAAGSTEELSMLVVGGQFFMQMPASMGMPTDTPWLTIDPSGTDPVSEMFGSMAEEMSHSTDVQNSFAENSDLVEVEEVGTDTVDGVEVTEYVMTVDAEDLNEFGGLPDTGLPEGAVPFDSISYSLFVDGDALLRKLSTDLGGMGTMEMRFFDFGASVEVEAPPEDEVTDFGSMMDGLMDLSDEELAELMDQ